MNDSPNSVASTATNSAARLDDIVRRHPGGALLVAAGLGLVAVMAARAFNPPPPRNRAMQLLEDIQQRLSELAHHGYDQVASIAEDGVDAAGKGLGSLHLDRKLDKVGRVFRNLFH